LKQGESRRPSILTHQQAADKTGVQRECACGGLSDPHGECVECRQRRLASQRPALEILQAQPDQRQLGTPNPAIRVGIIPVAEFIRHVETVEQSYPTKSPQEILTMIRSLYYGSPA
jgi:hypothetical protein